MENEIILGDAYELIKTLPDKSVDLIVTDPPYLYDRTGFAKERKTGILRDRTTQFDIHLAENGLLDGIDFKILEEFIRVMKKINCYIWCNKAQIYDYLTYFVKDRGCNWEMLIWTKDEVTPFCGSHYLIDKEYCLYFWETGAKVEIPYERGKTVFFTRVNKADKRLYGHPTIKPEEIIENLILNSSGGGLILDPFCGSGTTCAVAKRLGLPYLGFEISPKWHKVAVDRINGITKRERDSGYIQEKLF